MADAVAELLVDEVEVEAEFEDTFAVAPYKLASPSCKRSGVFALELEDVSP